MSYSEHPKVRYETRLAPEGERIRAVILGQHPTRVRALAELINGDGQGVLNVVAGVSDILDCGVVLNAQIPRVDLLICGGYFDLEDIKDMLFQVANSELRLIKVPDGLMMEGGGPPAVKAWIYEQIRNNEFTQASQPLRQ
ncbi:hypothetical protein RHOSPDRAFT_32866 [Rhodotorula sp. JG-1b]|nr:hypothetical protein RHOSPDRAFT_32866 [Rhodotorula sp. JG-1b]